MSDELLRRTFDLSLEEQGDGRTLEGLCVPFGVPATVVDPPDPTPYLEQFAFGAFDRAEKAPNRVLLNFEHRPGISNVLGSGLAFEQREKGLYGTLAVDEGADGEKALRLYRSGVLTSLSVEFKPMGKPRIIDGVVTRTSVHLDAVAMCRKGAYEEAEILAVRADPVVVTVEEQPLAFPGDLLELLEQVDGLDVPEALKAERAHPAEASTPPEGDTLASATPAAAHE